MSELQRQHQEHLQRVASFTRAARSFVENKKRERLMTAINAAVARSEARRRERDFISRLAQLPIEKKRIIIRIVARSYGVKLSDLMGSRRHARLVEPRQVAMYLCREITGQSFNKIGAAFSRDHSTVVHATQKMAHRVKNDIAFAATISGLKAQVAS